MKNGSERNGTKGTSPKPGNDLQELQETKEPRQAPVERRLLTVEEAAVYLGISAHTIYGRINRRSKRPFPVKPKRIGKAVRFDIRDLDAFIEGL